MRGAAGRGGLRRYRRGIAEERRSVAGGEMGRGGEPDRVGRGCYAGRGVALRQCAVDRKGASERAARLGSDRARLGGEPLRSENTHRHPLRGRSRRSRRRASRAAGLPARQGRALDDTMIYSIHTILLQGDAETICTQSVEILPPPPAHSRWRTARPRPECATARLAHRPDLVFDVSHFGFFFDKLRPGNVLLFHRYRTYLDS